MAAKKTSRNRKKPAKPITGVAEGPVTKGSRTDVLDRLEIFIGRWLTEGNTVADSEGESMPIVASDVYQWVPGGHFVVHPAYGRIGWVGVGGLEVIGYDPATDQFQTHFFDSQGNVTTETLSQRDDQWIWQGESTRCIGTFSEGGKKLTARHERLEGNNWVPSMTVTLRKID